MAFVTTNIIPVCQILDTAATSVKVNAVSFGLSHSRNSRDDDDLFGIDWAYFTNNARKTITNRLSMSPIVSVGLAQRSWNTIATTRKCKLITVKPFRKQTNDSSELTLINGKVFSKAMFAWLLSQPSVVYDSITGAEGISPLISATTVIRAIVANTQPTKPLVFVDCIEVGGALLTDYMLAAIEMHPLEFNGRSITLVNINNIVSNVARVCVEYVPDIARLLEPEEIAQMWPPTNQLSDKLSFKIIQMMVGGALLLPEIPKSWTNASLCSNLILDKVAMLVQLINLVDPWLRDYIVNITEAVHTIN